jgi:hypothetical protein
MIYFALSIYLCWAASNCGWHHAGTFISERECEDAAAVLINDETIALIDYHCTLKIFDTDINRAFGKAGKKRHQQQAEDAVDDAAAARITEAVRRLRARGA